MKNKLMTFLTIAILIVGCVLMAAADKPVAVESTHEEIEVETEETIIIKLPVSTPVLPDPGTENIIVSEPEVWVEPDVISEEYPIAAQVWNAMKHKGWSDEICAGIMGNMMAECGGRTLNLRPDAIGDSGTSFGLCQWHANRMNNLKTNYGESIEAQIDFLAFELGDMNIFTDLTDYKQIAYDFCVYFERPSNKEQKGHDRKALAQTAFEHFSGK